MRSHQSILTRKAWKSAAMHLWTREEEASYLHAGLCEQSQKQRVVSLTQKCELCPVHRKRGRPFAIIRYSSLFQL